MFYDFCVILTVSKLIMLNIDEQCNLWTRITRLAVKLLYMTQIQLTISATCSWHTIALTFVLMDFVVVS